MTNPSRSASNGREAVAGSSFLVDNAFIALNPPIPTGFMAASEPPETMMSALFKRMRLKASISALVEDAQALTVV